MSWQKIKNWIGFDRLRFSSSPDSSSGENKVFPASSPPPPPPLPPPPPVFQPADDNRAIEVGPSSTASTAGGDAPLVETDFKRVGKMAYNLTIGVMAISVTLLVKIPQPTDSDWCTLRAYEAAFACMSFILSIGLAYYSIMSPEGEKLAWVQVRVMACYGLLVIVAVFFHMAAMFPLFDFITVLLAIAVVIGLVILCLYLAWAKHKKTQ